MVLDLNGDGVQTGWVSGEDALLAIDNKGNGVIDDRSELDLLHESKLSVEGEVRSQKSEVRNRDLLPKKCIYARGLLFGGDIGEGFAKLASFNSNDDGLVDGNDARFSDLQVWQDANENALTDAGELMSLDAAGVASFNTGYTNVFSTDTQGNMHGEPGSATLADGSAIDLVDVYFQVES